MELWNPPGYCDFPLDVEYYEDEESWGTEEPEEGYAVYRRGKFAIVVKR